MNRTLSPLLLSILIISTLVNASCFDENTTIETSEIGAQIVDTLGCGLIELNSNWGDLIKIFYVFILVFLSIILSLIALSLIHKRNKKGRKT